MKVGNRRRPGKRTWFISDWQYELNEEGEKHLAAAENSGRPELRL
jgi:hypothetical protein